MVDSPISEDKMGETVASNPSSLKVSVSFGRFESESLSWEKWSSFSPNKYLEEVEKCATPGSVAQKKAYFEAHYKKIAARKAELLDQEKQMEQDRLRSEAQNKEEDLSDKPDAEFGASNNTLRTDAEFNDTSNGQDSFIKEIKQAINSAGEVNVLHLDGMIENIARDYQSTSTEEEKKEPESRSNGSQLVTTEPEEAVYTKEEITPIEADKVKEISGNVDNGIAKGQACQVAAKDVKSDHPKESKKGNHVNKESSVTKTKRKPVVPTSKAHPISTPRSSRPTSTLTKTLPSASSSKKGNSPSLSGRKNASTLETKKVANKSLHMSLSLGPSNCSDPVPITPMRKSFIMEKMGDKDIVKRAFKTFQNNFNQPKISGEARSIVKEQVPSKGTEAKFPSSMSMRKENGRPRTVDSLDKRSGNVVRSTMGLKSDVRAVKGKEPLKKLVGKSDAKEAERTRLQSKPKEEKGSETKRSKPKVKTTSLPTFYRGQKGSERHPEKGGIKPEKPR